MKNYYYNPAPELEIVLCVNAAASYEFDMFVVLRACQTFNGFRKGTLFYMIDSGCSCPVPFDGREPIKVTKREVIKEFDVWAKRRLSSTYASLSGAEYVEATSTLYDL